MIKWVLRKAIGKFERDWNYDAGYMRDMIDISPRAAWLFSRVTALGQRSHLSHGLPPALPLCATRTAAPVRSWPSRWRNVPV
jgi:hypothetical protein